MRKIIYTTNAIESLNRVIRKTTKTQDSFPTDDLSNPTVIHWHGLTPPFGYDGSNVSQQVIASRGTHHYQFDLARSGSNWMQ